jgi:flavin-dependent dehydrogenase
VSDRDYTPTTKQVRADYGNNSAASRASFDRWLAAERSQVRAEVIDWIEGYTDQPEFVTDDAREHFAPKPEGTEHA